MQRTAKLTLILTLTVLAVTTPAVSADWIIGDSWKTGTWEIQQYPEATNPANTNNGPSFYDPTPTPNPDATTSPDVSPNPSTEPDILNPENLPYAFYFIVAVFFVLAVGVVASSNQSRKKNRNTVVWKPY